MVAAAVAVRRPAPAAAGLSGTMPPPPSVPGIDPPAVSPGRRRAGCRRAGGGADRPGARRARNGAADRGRGLADYPDSPARWRRRDGGGGIALPEPCLGPCTRSTAIEEFEACDARTARRWPVYESGSRDCERLVETEGGLAVRGRCDGSARMPKPTARGIGGASAEVRTDAVRPTPVATEPRATDRRGCVEMGAVPRTGLAGLRCGCLGAGSRRGPASRGCRRGSAGGCLPSWRGRRSTSPISAWPIETPAPRHRGGNGARTDRRGCVETGAVPLAGACEAAMRRPGAGSAPARDAALPAGDAGEDPQAVAYRHGEAVVQRLADQRMADRDSSTPAPRWERSENGSPRLCRNGRRAACRGLRGCDAAARRRFRAGSRSGPVSRGCRRGSAGNCVPSRRGRRTAPRRSAHGRSRLPARPAPRRGTDRDWPG
ncbi:hypothetical protein EDC50_1960 [Vulcaniibacterium tengchongense]|uniref:Uncharacterized protein n=1 Tax=Vulcaniibacterium tengchongense TaxID=1273429 RepID=A0A3N4VBY2_9GAMM|nr:hypothetical protein EDC50_1960 [Vulcaniibacterium tengchongense]